MSDEDDLCYSFGDQDAHSGQGAQGGTFGGGRNSGQRGRGRGRGRGGHGRPRGPRCGTERREEAGAEDAEFPLRRYSSTDSVNRGRGGRRDRGGNHYARGRDYSRDHSFDVQRDSEREERRGGRGGEGRRGGEGGRGFREGDGQGRWNHSSRGGAGHPRNFPIRAIADIEDVEAATLRLNSQIDDFSVFMSKAYMSQDDTLKTLKVLTRVLQNDLQREIVLKVLQIVCTSRFLDTHLAALIPKLSSLAEFGSASALIEVVDSICQVLRQVCHKMRSYASKGMLLVTVLLVSSDVVQLLERQKPELVEGLKELQKECQECVASFHAAEEGKDRSRGRDRRRGPNEDDDVPPDDFAQLPIFPSPEDMNWNEKIFLRANKEEGSYRDVNHYLDVQFRLLREDYIRPLRTGIRDFKYYKDKGEAFKKSQDLRLYPKVQIISMVCKDSLEHRLQFEMTPQLKRVRWQSSKRLLFGSLVCLTMDDFDTIFFAVVTNRDMKDLEKGIIQIRFESGLDEVLDLSSTDIFTMAETTAYFEAYRHVLEGLQEMKDSLPMDRYLVQCSPTISPPKYLRTGDRMGQMNLTSLLNDSSHYNYASSVPVVYQHKWPPVEETTLNESQLEAVKTALSKELAIIQGPPGTGKTYVGLKMAKILLENRQVWTDPTDGKRPILVVCYTNHALDQFLEGILSFCPEGIVRVGSRCKNPQLEDFNLKNIRRKARNDKKVSRSVHNSIRDAIRKLNGLKSVIDKVSSKLEATCKGIISSAVLEHYMLEGQYQSLLKRGQYTSSVAVECGHSTVMMEWLSKGAVVERVGGQEEEEDPYPMLVREVTLKILQGEGGRSPDSAINPKDVHVLPATVRAQLYRFWLDKAKALLQKDATSPASQGSNPQEAQRWREAAKHQILPDAILQRVMQQHLFSAIIQPFRANYPNEENFCMRAWLGIFPGESEEVMARILQGNDTANERQFRPDEVANLPHKTRIQLYRFWVQKTTQILKKMNGGPDPMRVNQIFAKAWKEILPDDILKLGMHPEYFRAIQMEMVPRHRKQAEYFIRAWLGVQDFCQNTAQLERLLDQLDEESEVREEEEGGGGLNVEEEAEVIQTSRRLDDDDDDALFDFGKKKSRVDVQSAMQELGVQSTFVASARDNEGFSLPKYQLKKHLRKLKGLLMSSKPMEEEDASRVVNLWSQQLSVEDRTRLYLFWLRRYQDFLRQSVKDQAEEYNRCSQELREVRMGEDKALLEEATVIGMTTTGAARYRRVLTGVACPIIILEEAAEVLEAHVVTTLHKTCQHLILIGDHQQLKPSPTVYELSLHYKLDLSLFERLVNNKLHHSTLAVQHRMRPEVARLVRHVYPELKDHETTLKRPHIRGMKHDVFLFHHEVEETRNDETSSKSNQYEAELCMRLCRFLVQQGYPSDCLTILTAYSGQVFTLKNIMKSDQDFFRGVRVTAVDNYQGEENDIILLSLVRSNQQGAVGFLGSDNRVCVALSRARNGFFAFGNFRILADSSPLWKNICRTAKENEQLGDTLLLRCENHPGQEAKVTTAKDFDQMPEGGCKLPCTARLKCGHVCDLSCHVYDREHKDYKCRKKCERIPCKLGHPCRRKCGQDCGKCEQKVTKTIPMCGHDAEMECHRDPHLWLCKDRCKGTLPCGHQCSGECGDCRKKRVHVSECKEKVQKVWPCGHLVDTPCHVSPGELPCDKPCGAQLACSHLCKGTCGQCWSGRVHLHCKEKCRRPLPGCGHRCPLPCGTTCLPCSNKKCGTGCSHSVCKLRCGEPCQDCTEICPWRICKHQKCESLCHDPCPPCDQPCPRRKLPCGTDEDPHPCSGRCGEKCFCFRCERDKSFSPMAIEGVETVERSIEVEEGKDPLVKLSSCSHIFKVAVLDVYVRRKAKSLPAWETINCPVAKCNERILAADCWRYHRLFQERHVKFQKVKEDLQKATTVSHRRRQKLLDSLDMLKHDAEKHKSFASKAQRGQVLKPDVPININTALALTNQIKMTKVFETTLDCYSQVESMYGLNRKQEGRDIDVLQKLLYTPAKSMSPQRLQELSAATRRFAIMTKLLCATKLCTTSHLVERMESSLKTLKEKSGTEGFEVAEAVLRDHQSQIGNSSSSTSSLWSYLTGPIDVSILDEPPEKDLCDISKRSQKPGSAKTLGSSGMLAEAMPLQTEYLRVKPPAVPPKQEQLRTASAFGTRGLGSTPRRSSQEDPLSSIDSMTFMEKMLRWEKGSNEGKPPAVPPKPEQLRTASAFGTRGLGSTPRRSSREDPLSSIDSMTFMEMIQRSEKGSNE